MRISDWSSDVCSSDLLGLTLYGVNINEATGGGSAIIAAEDGEQASYAVGDEIAPGVRLAGVAFDHVTLDRGGAQESLFLDQSGDAPVASPALPAPTRSEEHTSELQSLMRTSYAVFCLQNKTTRLTNTH